MGLCGIGREVLAGGVESRIFGLNDWRRVGMGLEGQFFVWHFRNSGIVIFNTAMRLSQRDVHLKSLGYTVSRNGAWRMIRLWTLTIHDCYY